MSCFQYAGAADLDSVIGDDVAVVESSEEMGEKSSSEEDLLTNKKGKKRRKTKKQNKPTKKKQKTSNSPISAPRVEPINLYSDEDEDLSDFILGTDSLELPQSEKTIAMSNTLDELRSTARVAKKMINQNAKRRFSDFMEDSPISSPKSAPTAITVTLQCEDEDYEPIKLRVSMKDTFGKILDIYASANDFIVDKDVKLKLDGMPLKKMEQPCSYGMRDGDCIKVYIHPINILLPMESKEVVAEGTIMLVLRDGDKSIKFSLHKAEPFQKLIDGFCKHSKTDTSKVQFIFDGEDLDPELTPQDEDMEDGDIIEVKIK